MADREKVIEELEDSRRLTAIQINAKYHRSRLELMIKGIEDVLDLLKEQEAQRDYEASVEMVEYCERYEQTYNPEDGSM